MVYSIGHFSNIVVMAEKANSSLCMCIKHPDEQMDIYCKTCMASTCNECLKTDHIGHDFDTIAKVYRKLNNRRFDIIRDFEMQVASKSSHNREHLREVRTKNDQLLKRNIESVEQKRAEIHETTDILINAHVHSLQSHDSKLREDVCEKGIAFEEQKSVVQKMAETFKKTTMKGLDLIEYYEELKSKVYALRAVDISTCCNEQVYVTHELDRKSMQRLIGDLKDDRISHPHIQQISSFRHCKSTVHTICPISSDEAWITSKHEKEFTLLRTDGHCAKRVAKDTKRHSFVLQNQFFLLCNEDKRNILKINVDGKKSVWLDSSPLMSCFIGHAMNGNFLVTFVDQNSGFRTENSQRKVQMMTPNGNVIHTYEHRQDGTTPVFTFPGRVTQNYNTDVCVVNHFDDANGNWRGNVCVFYEDGPLKFIYSGSNEDFEPYGICCNSLSNIICVNRLCDTIHVVSSKGSFLKYLFIRDTCVPEPCTLALHRDVLWVGSWGGEVRVYRYNF